MRILGLYLHNYGKIFNRAGLIVHYNWASVTSYELK